MNNFSCVFDKQAIQWSPSITDTTGTKDFVLYSEVSFAQRVIVDHAPLTIVASQLCWSKTMDHEISRTDEKSIDCLALIQESRTYLGYIATIGR